MEIKVKNSGVIDLSSVASPPAGTVYIAESERSIPFAIKRVYFIAGMESGAVRGDHAHRTLMQAIFAAHGSFTLCIDDGAEKQEIKMDNPAQGILLAPHLWTTMRDFSPDCVILVFADDWYDTNEYIRDYEEFLRLTKDRML